MNHYHSISSSSSSSTKKLFHEAHNAYDKGDYKTALNYANQIFSCSDGNATSGCDSNALFLLLGATHLQLRNFSESLFFHNAILLNIDATDNNITLSTTAVGSSVCYCETEAYNNIAIVMKELDDFHNAKTNFEKAIRICPRFPYAYSNLASLLSMMKEQAQLQGTEDKTSEFVLKTFETALLLSPCHIDTIVNLSLFFVKQAQRMQTQSQSNSSSTSSSLFSLILQRAKQLYIQAIQHAPSQAAIPFSNLSFIFNIFRDPKQAIYSCEKALEVQPFFPDAWNNLGISYLYQFLLEGNWQGEEILSSSSDTKFSLQLVSKAIELFDKAIQMKPKFALTYGNLAMSHYYYLSLHSSSSSSLKNPVNDKILHLLQRSIQLDPRNVDALHNLGNMYFLKTNNTTNTENSLSSSISIKCFMRVIQQQRYHHSESSNVTNVMCLAQAYHSLANILHYQYSLGGQKQQLYNIVIHSYVTAIQLLWKSHSKKTKNLSTTTNTIEEALLPSTSKSLSVTTVIYNLLVFLRKNNYFNHNNYNIRHENKGTSSIFTISKLQRKLYKHINKHDGKSIEVQLALSLFLRDAGKPTEAIHIHKSQIHQNYDFSSENIQNKDITTNNENSSTDVQQLTIATTSQTTTKIIQNVPLSGNTMCHFLYRMQSLFNIGNIYEEKGDLVKAITWYDKIVSHYNNYDHNNDDKRPSSPSSDFISHILFHLAKIHSFYLKAHICDWSSYNADLKYIQQEILFKYYVESCSSTSPIRNSSHSSQIIIQPIHALIFPEDILSREIFTNICNSCVIYHINMQKLCLLQEHETVAKKSIRQLQQQQTKVLNNPYLTPSSTIYTSNSHVSPQLESSKIRIGYISSSFDLYTSFYSNEGDSDERSAFHPIQFMMQTLLSVHDKSKFDVFCYSLLSSSTTKSKATSDSSFVATKDDLVLEHKYDDNISIQNIRNLSSQEAANHIYNDRIHILINLDGYIQGARHEIFAFRPAPIQITWMSGYTMGSDNLFDNEESQNHVNTEKISKKVITNNQYYSSSPVSVGLFDYIISDKTVMVDNPENHVAERIIYLPHCFVVADYIRYEMITQNTCKKNPNNEKSLARRTLKESDMKNHMTTTRDVLKYTKEISIKEKYDTTDDKKKEISVRAKYGISEDVFVYACFTECFKIDPVLFQTWMEILTEVNDERSVLVLVKSSDIMVENMRNEAIKRGVSPNRIVFVNDFLHGEEEEQPTISSKRRCVVHHSIRSIADLVLDTRVYNNGFLSSCDCLWAGVPMITIKGDRIHNRLSASLLNSMGLEGLVTNTLEEYKKLAVTLNSDEDRYIDIIRHIESIKQKRMQRDQQKERLFQKTINDDYKRSLLFDSKEWVKSYEIGLLHVVELWNKNCIPRDIFIDKLEQED